MASVEALLPTGAVIRLDRLAVALVEPVWVRIDERYLAELKDHFVEGDDRKEAPIIHIRKNEQDFEYAKTFNCREPDLHTPPPPIS